MSDQEVGSIFSDMALLVELRPVLPLVQKLKNTEVLSERFIILAEIADFLSVHLFKTDVKRKRWMAVLRLAAETVKNDPRWQTVIAEALQ